MRQGGESSLVRLVDFILRCIRLEAQCIVEFGFLYHGWSCVSMSGLGECGMSLCD
jgi:hypothetical protein